MFCCFVIQQLFEAITIWKKNIVLQEKQRKNIIIVFLLLIRLNEFQCNPLKSSKQLKSNNTIEDTKNRYFWTIHQLERCYLWSKTLPYENRLDYLITLRRKVHIHFYFLLDKIVPNIKI